MRLIPPSQYLAPRAPSLARGRGAARPNDVRLPGSIWASIAMKCGHYTTPEEQLFYRVWRPKRGVHYCEQCHRWTPLAPKNRPIPMPQEALF